MNTVAAMHPVFSMPVHPAAEIFPMLPEEELLELATNIKSNGLRDSIVIAAEDGIEMLIDGRNRREACKLSGVEPTTRKLPDGTDIKAYVVSANVARGSDRDGAGADLSRTDEPGRREESRFNRK